MDANWFTFDVVMLSAIVIEITWLLPGMTSFWAERVSDCRQALRCNEASEEARRRVDLYFRSYKRLIDLAKVCAVVELCMLAAYGVYWVCHLVELPKCWLEWVPAEARYLRLAALLAVVLPTIVLVGTSLWALGRSRPVQTLIECVREAEQLPGDAMPPEHLTLAKVFDKIWRNTRRIIMMCCRRKRKSPPRKK